MRGVVPAKGRAHWVDGGISVGQVEQSRQVPGEQNVQGPRMDGVDLADHVAALLVGTDQASPHEVAVAARVETQAKIPQSFDVRVGTGDGVVRGSGALTELRSCPSTGPTVRALAWAVRLSLVQPT